MKSTPKFLPWIGAALLAVAGVLQVMMAIRGGYDAGTPPGVMLVGVGYRRFHRNRHPERHSSDSRRSRESRWLHLERGHLRE